MLADWILWTMPGPNWWILTCIPYLATGAGLACSLLSTSAFMFCHKLHSFADLVFVLHHYITKSWCTFFTSPFSPKNFKDVHGGSPNHHLLYFLIACSLLYNSLSLHQSLSNLFKLLYIWILISVVLQSVSFKSFAILPVALGFWPPKTS